MLMNEITVVELHQKMEDGEKIVLVDVREPYEHEEFDIGGINIPLAEIPSSQERFAAFGDVDIVLYCRSGNRSGMAQKILAMQHQIQNTLNLRGGLIAWKQEISS